MGLRVKPESLQGMKQRGEPIAVLTCYDCPTARLMDGAGVDVIFVGDSVGVNVLGYESPLQVTMEDMLHHTRAVRRGVEHGLLLSDLPFGSYETVAQAVENARRLIDAGAEAVKVEGVEGVVVCVEAMVAEGIAVVGHTGHTPQTREGQRPVFGDRAEDALAVLEGAGALEAAGACAVVLECVPERVAEAITEGLNIPTIGIGAGRPCDGQVLVTPDLLGLNEVSFRYLKRYANVGPEMAKAFSAYVAEVKERRFPGEAHRFLIKTEELRKFNELRGA
ncbi:MAG: 3-methyl-2-oxobutanoate hydroxymethyltransferase [bacterium]|nr:3-methyl-2-oxobutanoate hydroxymethyltransferase [bacterium]